MAGEAAGDERRAQAQASRLDPESGDQWRPTGEPRVDAALARLDELPGLPVTEHARVFEDVHRGLEDVLDELEAGQLGEAGRGHDAVPGPGR
jgi:hypothetical protein